MRVPYSPVGDTKPSTQGLNYAQDYSDLAAQPWKQVAAALTGLGGEFKARESRDQNFDALEKFSAFQQNWDKQSAEIDNATEPNDQNYLERKQAAFDNMSGQFLQTVAPEKRKEYQARIAQYRVGQAAGSLNFDYKQKDNWYRTGVAKVYTQAQIDFDKDPTPENLKAQQAKIKEALDATNLNESEKNKLADETSLGMLGLSYKKDVEKAAKNPTTAVPVAASDYYSKLRQIESGGNDRAVSSTGAKGRYQFTSGTARRYDMADPFDVAQQESAVRRLTEDNRAYLTKALGRAPTDGELYLAHQQGAGGAATLLSNPNSSAEAAVGEQAVRVNGGKPGMTAGEFAQMWTKRFDGAKASTNVDSVNNDPKYVAVPLDVRQQIQADVDRSIKQQQAAETAAARQTHDAFLSSVYTDVSRGKVGSQQLNQLLDDGKIDYDEFAKGQAIIDKGAGENKSLLEAQGRRTSGLPLDASQQNTLYKGEGGQDKLWSMDTAFVGAMMKNAKDYQATSSEFTSQLKSMFMGTDAKRALFAVDALDQLRQASTNAFGSLDDTTRNAVNAYHELSKTISKDEVLTRLRGGLAPTPEEMQQTQVLRDRGNVEFTKQDVGIAAGGDKLASLGELPNATFAGPAWWGWYRAQWTENFVLTGGNSKKATAITNATADTVWTVTTVGGRKALMMNAPETIGLPMVDDAHDWMTPVGKRQLGLGPEESFQIYSDNQTQKEVDAFKQGVGPAPSWPVITFSKNGTPSVAGRRVTMELPSDYQTLNDKDYTLRQLDGKIANFQEEFLTPADPFQSFVPLDPELQQEYDALLKQREELAKGNEEMRKQLKGDPSNEPSFDPLGNVQ